MVVKHQDDNLDAPHSPTATDFADHALKATAASPRTVDKDKQTVQTHTRRPTKRFLVWRLTQRKWLVAIVASVLVVLALVLVLLWFVVVVPLFQRNADKVAVTLNYLDIIRIDRSADARSIGVNVSFRVAHDVPIHVATDAATATLIFDSVAFATVELPPLDLATGPQAYDIMISGDAHLTNTEAFKQLASALITRPCVTVDATAQLTAHAFGLTKRGVAFQRTLSIPALDNFKAPAPTINAIAVTSCTNAAIELAIHATITNAARVGLDGVGALNLSLYHEQRYVGFALTHPPPAAGGGVYGIPRGASQQRLDVVIANSTAHTPVFLKMLMDFAVDHRPQLWLTGENAFVTDLELLRTPLQALNVSIASTENLLSKIEMKSECDLESLVLGT